MAKLGQKARITLATKSIGLVKSEDFSLKTDVADITTKDSLNWSEVLPTKHTGSFSAEVVYEKKPSGSPTQQYAADLLALQINMTLTAITFAFSDTTGDIKLTGNVYITDFALKSATSDVITYTITLTPSGEIAVGSVS